MLQNIFTSFLMGFVDLLLLPWRIYQWFQLETLKERMNAIMVVGNSSEFLCVVLALMVVLIIIGLVKHGFLVTMVDRLESFNGKIGQFAAWFALILMIQQILIIVMGQVFRGNLLSFAPFGLALTSQELQWLSGQLKLYNAILIAFASAYTFIEGGHVRVDLIYAGVGYRVKKWIDLAGTLLFLLPSSLILWWFAWPLAMNSMFAQKPLNIWSETARWRKVKWESSGTAEFSWVWAFKFLVLVFAALMIIQGFAFLLRNIRALRETKEIETHPNLDRVDSVPNNTVVHS